ncbi:MAG: hypothetical protein K8R23_01400 [Chthoniobacter sp.]|nr:hypothetical protein [Chthoniobacter sp.]
MPEKIVQPSELAAIAKSFREGAGKTRTEVARELEVAQPTVHFAEEEPERGLHKLRKQIIERYSDYEVIGPVYLLRKKR